MSWQEWAATIGVICFAFLCLFVLVAVIDKLSAEIRLNRENQLRKIIREESPRE